jgi:phosphoglucomutase
MKPGTSGLRKKVSVWESPGYLENFVQAAFDAWTEPGEGGEALFPRACDAAGDAAGDAAPFLLLAGDGRFFSHRAIRTIAAVAAGNGISLRVPQSLPPSFAPGLMSTPACSAFIRSEPDCLGGLLLTASHNPGGPDEDFGIKFNLAQGQPADEAFTDRVYERSLAIEEVLSFPLEDDAHLDLSAPPGTVYPLSGTATLTVVDPFPAYLESLRASFSFEKLRALASRPDFRLLFDGMHGAGGPFARRLLVEELGLPERSLMRCDPRDDFGGGHPDPNLK